MGIITLKIDDKLERLLRKKAGERGVSKGAISEAVEEALRLWLGLREETGRKFLAVLNGKKIAEGKSLEELASKLRGMNIDPRDVLIESHPSATSAIRMGLHLRKEKHH